MINWTDFVGAAPRHLLNYGVWLSRAAIGLARNKCICERLDAAEQEFIERSDGLSPEAFAEMPKGDGSSPRRPNMPAFVRELELSAKLSDPKQQAFGKWRALKYQLEFDLMGRLEAGDLIAFGEKGLGGPLEYISLSAWKYLKIDPDQKDVVCGNDIVFYNVQVIERSRIEQNQLTAPVPPVRRDDLRAVPNKRGPESRKRTEASNAMIAAVQSGELTIDELERMKIKSMVQFQPAAGQTTLVDARKAALTELRKTPEKE
jgi:hypothetical protein